MESVECVLKKLLIYIRLGHREQKDEWAPRRIDVFTRHNVLPSNAIVSAGGMNSACTAGMVPIHPLAEFNAYSLFCRLTVCLVL